MGGVGPWVMFYNVYMYILCIMHLLYIHYVYECPSRDLCTCTMNDCDMPVFVPCYMYILFVKHIVRFLSPIVQYVFIYIVVYECIIIVPSFLSS